MTREKIGYFLIVLFAILSVSAIVVRMIPREKEEVGRLGVVGREYQPCIGNLEVTFNPMNGGKCMLQADVEMKNCRGRWYVFKGNECGGTLVCSGEIRTLDDKWRCSWEGESGVHSFTLCENIEKKDSVSIVC